MLWAVVTNPSYLKNDSAPDKLCRETAEINHQKIYIPTLLATGFLIMKQRRVRLPELTWICRAEGSAHARPTAGDN
jgi:hypothetical protein